MSSASTERAEGPVEDARDLMTIVEDALKTVEDPCSAELRAGWSIYDLGLLTAAYEDEEGGLMLEVALTDPLCPFLEQLEELILTTVRRETEYDRVALDISDEVAWDPSRIRRGERAKGLPLVVLGGRPQP